MRKHRLFPGMLCLVILLASLAGCAEAPHRSASPAPAPTWTPAAQPSPEMAAETPGGKTVEPAAQPERTPGSAMQDHAPPTEAETDWSAYFDGINGCAVLFDPAENRYQIYRRDLALTRRSPCSTFKIISSFVALKHGILDPEDSARSWSGEAFWNRDWNRDIDFFDAFRTSCVWYFRELIDEIGAERMQRELDRLQYGNCDLSDWAGRLNTNNSNPALTGFWIESSLLISPKEQADVMARIFGDRAEGAQEVREPLQRAMLLTEQEDLSLYGKTGMGKRHGVVVDAWYTGFADGFGKRIYFCVYLGETDGRDVSSARAREIAVALVSDCLRAGRPEDP